MRKIKMLVMMLALTAATFAANIGYINTTEIFQKYSRSKTVQDNLEKERMRIEGQARQKELELQKIQVDLQGKGSSVSDADKKKFQTQVEQFQKFIDDSRTKLIKEERTRIQEIEADLQAAVNQVAKAEKMDYILERGAMRFGGVNLTEKVLKQLESNKK